MSEITDQDIIAHLENKIQYHYSEAKRIENILSAFQHGEQLVQEGLGTRIKLKSPGKKGGRSTTSSHAYKTIEIPEAFSSGLKLNRKVIFALNQIQSGYIEDIAQQIAILQPELEAEKVKVQISGVLSSLKSKGVLTAKKMGRKDFFSINPHRIKQI